MHISAKADYGMRALLELAAAAARDPAALVKAEHIADTQQIPARFLAAILRDLRGLGIIESRRGAEGGYRLARPADAITVADVLRALDGPLAAVRDERPEDLAYEGAAQHLRDVWVASRVAIRDVLERVTLADVVRGTLLIAAVGFDVVRLRLTKE